MVAAAFQSHYFQAMFIAVMILIAALIKAAQFPFHTWLPESLELPTPVSAIMHAGIINAGGFLILRLQPVASLSPEALVKLAGVGGRGDRICRHGCGSVGSARAPELGPLQ
jgi:NADH:ubiquinone oxidoreductase subunit 5 (subunit L)/multisubunit Na+/H+ antiporter MnhA subunit